MAATMRPGGVAHGRCHAADRGLVLAEVEGAVARRIAAHQAQPFLFARRGFAGGGFVRADAQRHSSSPRSSTRALPTPVVVMGLRPPMRELISTARCPGSCRDRSLPRRPAWRGARCRASARRVVRGRAALASTSGLAVGLEAEFDQFAAQAVAATWFVLQVARLDQRGGGEPVRGAGGQAGVVTISGSEVKPLATVSTISRPRNRVWLALVRLAGSSESGVRVGMDGACVWCGCSPRVAERRSILVQCARARCDGTGTPARAGG